MSVFFIFFVFTRSSSSREGFVHVLTIWERPGNGRWFSESCSSSVRPRTRGLITRSRAEMTSSVSLDCLLLLLNHPNQLWLAALNQGHRRKRAPAPCPICVCPPGLVLSLNLDTCSPVKTWQRHDASWHFRPAALCRTRSLDLHLHPRPHQDFALISVPVPSDWGLAEVAPRTRWWTDVWWRPPGTGSTETVPPHSRALQEAEPAPLRKPQRYFLENVSAFVFHLSNQYVSSCFLSSNAEAHWMNQINRQKVCCWLSSN